MEVWEKEFEWLKVRHIVRDAMKKDTLPDLQTILFLIGVQELGRIPKEKFTKDGWPHWKEVKSFTLKGVNEQEEFLMLKIIDYFYKYNEITPFSLN